MILWGAGRTRRWQSAIASVAAFSLFVALVAGSALRPQFAAAALPEPAAWSQRSPDVGAHADQVRLRARIQTISLLAHGTTRDAAPTNKKPFHSMWMTKQRPTTWSRSSPQSVRSAVPVSFVAWEFQPGGAEPRAPAAVPPDRDVLTQFCVARR